MSTIQKNNHKLYATDISNEELEVGDLVVYAVGSTLRFAIVLGFTRNAIYLSNYNYTLAPDKKDYYQRYNDVKEHNDKRYHRYIQLKIIEKNVTLPEALKKFIGNIQKFED